MSQAGNTAVKKKNTKHTTANRTSNTTAHKTAGRSANKTINAQKADKSKKKTARSSVKSSAKTPKGKDVSSVYEEKYVLTEKDIKIRGEVKLLLALGATLLLLLSNFNMLPPVGNYISYFMFGMVGTVAYILPVLVFGAAAFLISNKGNKRAHIKFFASLGLFFFLIAAVQLIFMGYQKEHTAFYYYFHCGENKCGGGFFGALIANGLCKIVGVVGAYILLFVFLIISGVLVTERSFINGIKNGSRRVYNSARDDVVYRIRDNVRENVKEREYQKNRRIHKVAKGVNLNRIEDPDRQVEQMHEINEESFLHEDRVPQDELTLIDTGAGQRKTKKHSGIMDRTKLTPSYDKRQEESFYEEEEGSDIDVVHEEEHDSGYTVYPQQEESRYPYETYEMDTQKDRRKDIENNIQKDRPKDMPYQSTGSIIKAVEDVNVSKIPAKVYVDEEGNYHETEQIIVSERAKSVMDRPAYSFSENRENPQAEKQEGLLQNTQAEQKLELEQSELGPDGAVEIARANVENAVYESEEARTVERKKEKTKNYILPRTNLLKKSQESTKVDRTELRETAIRLEEILKNFGVKAKVTDYNRGPSVTRYEIQPEIGTRLNKITTLADDIKLNLAATDIRIEPIPGKSTIGIEVPNKNRESVLIRELIESKELLNHKSKIAFAAGKDIAGQVIVADIAKMPHFLIAGTTGSGKSVFTNSIIMSILFRAKPDEVRLIIVDPKVVEFGIYNGIPHLLQPVVTDAKMASNTLKWAVAEMSDRYKKFAELNVRDLKGYNEKVAGMAVPDEEERAKKLPQIVIVIDELADLMMVAAKEVEESICRLAQLARAAGIHLIIATQRPSVDVVTGLIKANIPSRCALMVSSGVDSRTIIDSVGAEKLLGNGDMLFYPSGYVKPVRLQGAFVSDSEVEKVVEYWKAQANGTNYDESIAMYVASQPTEEVTAGSSSRSETENSRDEYFADAARLVVEKEKASTSMLQRVFKIGFNRAARIVEQLEEAGIIGEEEGTKPRKVLMSQIELENFFTNQQ